MIAHNFVARTNLQLLPALVFTVFSQFAIAQKVVTKNWDNGILKAQETLDKKGFKTGECTYYHENGQLRLREFYVKGRREGTCEGWYDDGTPEYTRTYVLLQRNNGSLAGTEPVSVKNGKWIEYHDNGFKKKEENYENGVLIGEVRTWYDNGELGELKTMQDKFENGRYELYFENGQLWKKGQFVQGEKEGDWTVYHSNGQVAYNEIYRSDKIVDGPWRGKYPNGQDSLVGSYTNGRKEGTWEAFHDNGNVKSRTLFKFGLPSGEFIEYYADGSKRSEGSFGESARDVRRGREEGHWREWYENGQLMSDANYINGMRVGQYSEWYPNGQKKFEASYQTLKTIGIPKTDELGEFNGSRWTVEHDDRLEGLAREWYDNGLLMSEGFYVNGLRDGLWKEYYPNGSLQYEATFDKSKPSGLVTEYFENGRLRSKGHYEVRGRRKSKTGLWSQYYENGQVESEGEYINNKRQGRWREWYENGVVKIESFFESGRFSGEYKDYYFDGILKTHGSYKFVPGHTYEDNNSTISGIDDITITIEDNSLQQGEWKYYDDMGVLIRTEIWKNGKRKE